MTYYSQCGEDAFLEKHYFNGKKNGIYIELGALDGVLYSNTKYFEDNHNWSGILIEPHPIDFQKLRINRPANMLFNELVSNVDEPLEFLFFDDRLSQVSGCTKTLSQHHYDAYYNNSRFLDIKQNTKMIIPRSLTDIVQSTGLTHIDLLSLDVEGHEYEVLTSYDFKVPIDVILIKMLGVQPDRDELCRKILIEKGYTFDTKMAHNEIYIKKK